MATEDSRGIQEASLAPKLNQPEPESVFSIHATATFEQLREC